MSAAESVGSSRAPSAPSADRDFVSFDGGVQAKGFLQQPDRYRYWRGGLAETPRISRGSGLSYAAASFLQGGLSVSHRLFDRILDFDTEKQVVEVETGITLLALHRFLSIHGLYLPVQPGHGGITVGGCIAADVHGKNQMRDGTFINQVEQLVVVHPTHGVIELSPQQEPDLFRLTCGGFGLTGHIIRARLRASRAPTQWVRMEATPFSNTSECFDKLRLAHRDSDFAYTWHDMASANAGFGSGFLFQASFVAHQSSLEKHEVPRALSAKNRGIVPIALLNAVSARMLNLEYRRRQKTVIDGQIIPLQNALFPTHKAEIYFKLFGRAGFRECQAILPDSAIQSYIDAVHGYLRNTPLPIALASAKAFAGSRDLLRFTGAGICLALDVPAGEAADKFMIFLDEQMVALGGTPSIIKDSRLPRAVVDTCYPEADRFRNALRAYDPKRLFQSELSERVGL